MNSRRTPKGQVRSHISAGGVGVPDAVRNRKAIQKFCVSKDPDCKGMWVSVHPQSGAVVFKHIEVSEMMLITEGYSMISTTTQEDEPLTQLEDSPPKLPKDDTQQAGATPTKAKTIKASPNKSTTVSPDKPRTPLKIWKGSPTVIRRKAGALPGPSPRRPSSTAPETSPGPVTTPGPLPKAKTSTATKKAHVTNVTAYIMQFKACKDIVANYMEQVASARSQLLCIEDGREDWKWADGNEFNQIKTLKNTCDTLFEPFIEKVSKSRKPTDLIRIYRGTEAELIIKLKGICKKLEADTVKLTINNERMDRVYLAHNPIPEEEEFAPAPKKAKKAKTAAVC